MTEKAGFTNLKTNLKENCATFEVADDFDFEAKLNEIVEDGNKHVKGWSLPKKEDDQDDDTDVVMIKLPNMT